MNENNKKISIDSTETDEEKKNSLRPLSLSEFIGQEFIKSNLEAYIESSKKRKKKFRPYNLIWSTRIGKNFTSPYNFK